MPNVVLPSERDTDWAKTWTLGDRLHPHCCVLFMKISKCHRFTHVQGGAE